MKIYPQVISIFNYVMFNTYFPVYDYDLHKFPQDTVRGGGCLSPQLHLP